MQGRITKVLNMKPPEILAMIEEAAGTRMFEEKKDKALKTISKKDQKLLEITQVGVEYDDKVIFTTSLWRMILRQSWKSSREKRLIS